MLSRIQTTRPEDVEALDSDEMLEGYLDGFKGEPEPGNNRSYAYWHGWTKGAADGGHRQSTDADYRLAREYLRRGFDLQSRPGSEGGTDG